jgi:hypothetical protein
MRYLVLILLFYSQIFSAEIVLKNEKVFTVTILEEKEEYIKVKYKKEIYQIPIKEIIYINKESESRYDSYSVTKVLLPDGNVIRGKLISEDTNSITIENSEETIAIPKSSIVRIEKGTVEESNLPEEYKIKLDEKKTAETVWGVSTGIYKNYNQFQNYSTIFEPKTFTDNSFLVSFFYEPRFLKFKSFLSNGIDFSVLSSGALRRKNYTFLQTHLFFKLKYDLTEETFIYWKNGLGLSHGFYSEEREILYNLTSFSFFTEPGFEFTISENYKFHLGIRYIQLQKDEFSYRSMGPQLGITKNF